MICNLLKDEDDEPTAASGVNIRKFFDEIAATDNENVRYFHFFFLINDISKLMLKIILGSL
jgi:hypothetical protein